MVRKINISVAGSTRYAVQAIEALLQSVQIESSQVFTITSILTPAPKPVGRRRVITPNPLHQWAIDHKIPHVLVEKSLKYFQPELEKLLQSGVDILIVIDFGYLIRPWLLNLPKFGAVNIHPSRLPEWRGSSPGQCVLLGGVNSSASTIMLLDEQLDHGPILDQIEFAVDPNWTATEYYQHSFDMSNRRLPAVLQQLVDGNIKPHPQPNISPTPLARPLTKSDGFVPFDIVKSLQAGLPATLDSESAKIEVLDNHSKPSSSLLANLVPLFCNNRSLDPMQPASLAHYLDQATRALAPWPGLWTIIPTKKGDLNMKILSCYWDTTINRLCLNQVHIAGQQPATWNQIKNQIEKIEKD